MVTWFLNSPEDANRPATLVEDIHDAMMGHYVRPWSGAADLPNVYWASFQQDIYDKDCLSVVSLAT